MELNLSQRQINVRGLVTSNEREWISRHTRRHELEDYKINGNITIAFEIMTRR